MKTLKVPYLKTLDVLDLSSIGFLMEEKAHRDFISHANWKEQYPYVPIAVFDIARGETELYLRFFVKGNSLRAVNGIDNSPVHQDSCVEFFMKKPNDNVYMNFEFNCLGTCDAARRLSRLDRTSVLPEEYARIRRHSTVKSLPFSEKMGVFTWELTVAIPFDIMGLNPDNLPEKIYGNFYKCADETAQPHFLSWSPIDLPEPDFHCPQFFGEINF